MKLGSEFEREVYEDELSILERENDALRQAIKELREEHERLRAAVAAALLLSAK